MMMRRLLAAAALPCALGAQDTTAAKASLLAADRAASASSAAFRNALASNASVLVPDRNILRGRSDYTAHLTSLTAAPQGQHAWTPVHAVVSRDGLFGCTTGVLHLVAADTTQPSTGRYAACWRRASGGAWQLLAVSRIAAPARVKSLPDSMPGAPGSTGVGAPRGVNASRAMADADRAFAKFSADSGGPGVAFASWIAADGMMLGARAIPVRGPEQARQAFAGFPAKGKFEWGPIDALAAAAPDGSLGFTIGEARIAATPAELSYSKYLTIWRRDDDGRYRWVFDIGSDRPAPAGK